MRSIARIGAAVPAERESASQAPRKDTCQVSHVKGGSSQLTNACLYYRGTFDSGYSNRGVGEGIRGAELQTLDVLTMRLGKGSYQVPLSSISSISFKNKSYLTDSGFRCPFVGTPDLVVLAGQTPNGRVAVLPSSIDELSFSASDSASDAPGRSFSAPPALKWSASGFEAGAETPSQGFSNIRTEVYSPAINWEAGDISLAFRAAIEDYRESGQPNKDRSGMIWDKTFETRTVPVQVGPECLAVPFSMIRNLSVDSKGVPAITLRSGSVIRGTPYKNWRGFVWDSSEGASHMALSSVPPRLVFEEPGKVYAMGLGITASIVESIQHLYGQSDYLEWAMTLRIENTSRAPVQFGKDILLMDCSWSGAFDGVYAAYGPGAPEQKPQMTDFDSECQAYALANFERCWADGTMRGYRNGGTYVFGDPPDYHAEKSVCNSTLAAGAEVAVENEFTQGSYVEGHNRLLVILPAVSSGSARFRLVLSFVRPDRSGTWVLDSALAVRLTKDDLVASLKSANHDVPLSVLVLHWLTDVDPSAAAPFIDEYIRSTDRGLRQVASIQLLANSRLQPGPEALAQIKSLASGGRGWAALVAKRFLGAGE